MTKNFFFSLMALLISLTVLIIIYAALIIPYKIYSNSARSSSTQNYARFDEFYGYTSNHNLRSIVNLHYINRSYNLFTDKDGARISKNHLNKDSKENDVLVIGDSLSFGYGVNYEDTFVYLLGKNLNKEIKNFAVSGYSTVQSYKVLRNKLQSEKLIIYGFIEDHLRRNISKCGPTSGIYCTVVPVAELNKEKEIIISEKIFVNNFKLNQMYNRRLIERDYFQLKDIIYGFKYIKHSLLKRLGYFKEKYSNEEKLMIMKHLLDKMLIVANGNDANFLFVNIDLGNKKEIFNKISNLNFQGNIHFVDATPDVNEKKFISELIIKYDGHPNEKGHAYIKDKLEKYIKKNNLL